MRRQENQLREPAHEHKRRIRTVGRAEDPAGSQQCSRPASPCVIEITALCPVYLYPSPVPTFPDDLSRLRDVKLPVRFRIGAATREHQGETIGISPRQFTLASSLKLATGMRLTITVQVPMEISGSPFSEIHVTGQTVSVSELADKKFGYQVDLDPRR